MVNIIRNTAYIEMMMMMMIEIRLNRGQRRKYIKCNKDSANIYLMRSRDRKHINLVLINDHQRLYKFFFICQPADSYIELAIEISMSLLFFLFHFIRSRYGRKKNQLTSHFHSMIDCRVQHEINLLYPTNNGEAI